MSLNFYCEEEENNREESINKYKNLFSNYESNSPSLSEALIQMFESCELESDKVKRFTEDIISKCKERIDPDFNEIKNAIYTAGTFSKSEKILFESGDIESVLWAIFLRLSSGPNLNIELKDNY